jgi:hypothetical protein
MNIRKSASLLITFIALVLCGPGVRAGLTSLAYNHTTGAFTLSVPTTQGLLINSGTATGAGLNSTATLYGSSTTISVTVTPNGNLLDVTATFPVGRQIYEIGDNGDGMRGRLATTTIPLGSCAQLDTLPIMIATREAFDSLQRNREWESTPDHDEWGQTINNLVFFFLGTDFSADCSAFARPQDSFGCDGFDLTVTCGEHGACCDTHDACYAIHHCSAASWSCLIPVVGWSSALCDGGGGASCAICNFVVAACFMGPNTGPSTCCAAGNCGLPHPNDSCATCY